MAKAAKPKARAPLVTCEVDPPMFVYFSREVLAERETIRRLAHRIVDMAVDSGSHEWLGAEVAYSLADIARDQVINMVTDLIHEVRAEGKEARHG